MTTVQSVLDLTNQPIPNGTTPQIAAQLLDASGNDVPLSALTFLTLSIVDTQTEAVVNTCNAANILNTGRGAVSSTGAVTITLLAADTALLVATDLQEYRSLIIDWTYGASQVGRQQIDLLIVALAGA